MRLLLTPLCQFANHAMPLVAFTEYAKCKGIQKKNVPSGGGQEKKRASVVGSNRVVRGGSWNNNAENCRSAYRNNDTPDNRNNNVGFRLVFVP